jgi:hypothetical protein
VAADFDGDGDNDLADANANSYLPDHGLPVLQNDGTGRFAAPLFTPFPTEGESPFDLATGDFDDDGLPDVVALTLSNFGGLTWRIRVMFSDGDGTFTFGPSVLANDGDIAAGDVDGDGDPDVVFSDDDFVDPAMKVYLNAGNGRLQLADSYPQNGDFVALGDVNGDGSLDIVFDFGPIYVQLNDGAGGFGAPISSPLGEFCCYAFTLADWNGDGDLDVAGSNASGGDIFVGLGDGSGHFEPFGQYEDLAYQVISMASADFSGDGFPDMVASGDPDFSAVQQFVYLHGEGDGTFSRISVWDAGGWAMLAAEVNGDDLIDVISTDTISTGYAFVALSEGNGDFKASRTFLSVDGGSEIESSDVDHDGLVDLVVAGETFVAVHLNEAIGRSDLPLSPRGWGRSSAWPWRT